MYHNYMLVMLSSCKSYMKIVENVNPIKITEARNIKIGFQCWGLLSDYYIESVKIDHPRSGPIETTAIIRVADCSGQVTCAVKGPSVGLLFGLSREKWRRVETLCSANEQLFYRYFKDGIKNTFNFEQKLFYNFCASNQVKSILFALFHRCINMRKKDKADAFLQITHLDNVNNCVINKYILRLNSNRNQITNSNVNL